MSIYLDHSATTPVRLEVAELMLRTLTEDYGNPSSLHFKGQQAKQLLEKARESVADLIGAEPHEIVFTSGGTESDNLTILGITRAFNAKSNKRHLITTLGEHPAVINTFRQLEREGYRVTYLPLNRQGVVRIEDLKQALTEQTLLISIHHANNEIGSLQPIEAIGQVAKQHGVLFHTDAVQSLGKIPIDVQSWPVDLLSGSGHKIAGPKGTGFLYVRSGLDITPLTFGGSQEQKRRVGTENLPGVVGLGLAAKLAGEEIQLEGVRLKVLRDLLIEEVMKRNPDVVLTGHGQNRIPGHSSFCFKGIEGESLVLALSLNGIAASSGSACSSGKGVSEVLKATGLPDDYLRGALRLTLGRTTTVKDIRTVSEILPRVVHELRRISPIYQTV